jgi:two-component system, LytTR family, response regulator
MKDFVYFKTNGRFSQVCIADIQYIECLKKYAKVVTAKRTFLVTASMSCLEGKLPAAQFCRIHRSYIVSLQHAAHFDYEMVYITEPTKALPIGKQYKGILQQRLFVISNDEKESQTIPADAMET